MASRAARARASAAPRADDSDSYRSVNGRPQPPAGYPYQNSTLYPASAADRAAGATADYAQFFNQTFANLWGLTGSPVPPDQIAGDVAPAGMAEVRVVSGEPGRERAYRVIELLAVGT